MIIPSPMLTPREAANAMGISYPTIKKCILDGRLKTVKTPGGHHRLSLADIAAFQARQEGKTEPVQASLPQIIGMNQLQGEVASIRVDGLVAEIVLAIGDRRIKAIIPADAVSEMKLKVGEVASSWFKQSDVMLGRF